MTSATMSNNILPLCLVLRGLTVLKFALRLGRGTLVDLLVLVGQDLVYLHRTAGTM